MAADKIHFDRNRKVHLARRDAYFEHAVQLLYSPTQSLSTAQKIAHIEAILSMLGVAERHTFFVTHASQCVPAEREFLRFVRLLRDNVQSALSMLQHQLHLEEEESFLCQFLSATPEQCALPALHYQRRAEDILQGLWNILQLAHSAYHHLQQSNFAQLSAEDLETYRKAYASFRSDALAIYTPPAATASGTTAP
jgi:hypothetical protein